MRDGEERLVRLAQAGDREAMGKLLEIYGPVIGTLARRDLYRDYPDARQCAMIWAMGAIRTYEIGAGSTLKSWISNFVHRRRLDAGVETLLVNGRIRGRNMTRFARMRQWSGAWTNGGEVRTDVLCDSERSAVPVHFTKSFSSRDKSPDLADTVAVALRRLPPQEREVLARYYGLAGHEPRTMKQVGETMGISESRVSQIYTSAIELIRPELERLRRKEMSCA